MRTKFEQADVVNRFYSCLANKTKLTPLQTKVLGKIAVRRTAALGGHEEARENCGTTRYSYNSCGDRHCPKCQASRQAFWIDDLVRGTPPSKTLPHCIYYTSPVECRLPAQPKDVLRPAVCFGMAYASLVWLLA